MFIAIQNDNQILEAININCIKSFSIEPSDSQDEMYFLIAIESSPSEIQHYIAERNNRKDIQNILINILFYKKKIYFCVVHSQAIISFD